MGSTAADRFAARVEAFCRDERLVSAGQRVLLAVSGGPDSMALLELFARLRESMDVPLHVAHLNHCLRGDASDGDAAFVEDQARLRDLPVTVERIDVGARRAEVGGSLEAVARDVRYAFLTDVAGKVGADRIALGHHRGDLAETVLMQLLRGAGSAGLAGIRPIRDGLWIRPLLECSRDDILRFLDAEGVPYRTDASNDDLRFLRNRVRRNLMPALESYNPQPDAALSRAARILADEDALLSDLTDAAWERAADGDSIRTEPLRSEPVAVQRRVLKRWLDGLLAPARSATFEEVERVRRLALTGGRRATSLTRAIRLRIKNGRIAGETRV